MKRKLLNNKKMRLAAKNGIKKLRDLKNKNKARFDKIKNIKPPKKSPTYLTLLNLICGFLAMIFAINGRFDISTILIIGGFIFDILDGLVARMFNLTSDIGLELDSLADAVTFVITPALIVYLDFFETARLAIIVSIFIVVFGIYRLAKFNISGPMDHFTGLPTPFFAAVIIFMLFADIAIKEEALAIMIITFAYLMVSSVKYPNFKKESMKKYRYFGIILLLIFGIGLITQIDQFMLGLIVNGFAWIFFGIMLLIDKNVKRKKDIILFDAGLILITIAFYNKESIVLFLPFIYGIIASPLIERSFRGITAT